MDEKAQVLFGNKAWACLIRDFCKTGVLLEFPASMSPPGQGASALVIGDQVKIALRNVDHGKETTIRFNGEVRHRRDRLMGVKFLVIDNDALDLLSKMSGYDELKIVNDFNNHSDNSRDQDGADQAIQYPQVVKQLFHVYQRQVKEKLPSIISRALREVEASLLRSSGHSLDSWLRADFSRAIQVLNYHSHDITGHVLMSVLSYLETLNPEKKGTTNSSLQDAIGLNLSEDLSILEKDEFEDWLAMSMAIKTIENMVASDLLQLRTILEYSTGQPYSAKSCPMGPSNILKGFRQACSKLDLPVVAQSVIYKALGQRLKFDLGDFYASLISYAEQLRIKDLHYKKTDIAVSMSGNSFHNDQSVLLNSNQSFEESPIAKKDSFGSPLINMDYVKKVNKNKNEASALLKTESELKRRDDSYDSSEMLSLLTNEALHNEEENNTFNALQTLIKLKSAVTGGSLSGTPGTMLGQSSSGFKYLSRKEIQVLLFELKKELSNLIMLDTINLPVFNKGQAAVDMVKGHLKDVLVAWFIHKYPEEQQPPLFAEEESERIEITERLFDVILKLVSGNDILINWLGKLKIIILLEVLRDNSFFSNKQHPARKLINQLARLGSIKLTTNKSLQRSMAFFVSKAVTEYNGDAAIFESLLLEIDKLVERQEKAFQRNAERIARAFEGQKRLQLMRKKVREQLDARFIGKDVPEILLKLLKEGGWQQLMVVSLLREGIKSPSFKEQLRILDQLYHWLTAEQSLETELELDLEAEGLLDTIYRELSSSGQSGCQQIVKSLKACLLEGAAINLLTVTDFDWPDDEAKTELLSAEKLSLSSIYGKAAPYTKKDDGRWYRRAKKISLGDWIEFKEAGSTKRMRLAWSGSDVYRFVYVDSRGLQEIDITLDDFAGRMASGVANLLDNEEVPLVDQGLHQMVQSVYEDLASQASCDTLTGLINRQSFERNLERAVADSAANGVPYVIGYIDVDQFKVVNNTLGHLAGDYVLKHISQIIKKQVPPNTICSRIGGNEFGLIFQHCEINKSKRAADKIRQYVVDNKANWKGDEIETSLSIGLVVLDAVKDTLDTVLRKANIACGMAKERGRNRVVEYETDDKEQQHQDEMIHWVKRMDAHLESMLFLRCQEIRPVNPSAHPKSHYEILLGVLDEEGNSVPPDRFILAAEQVGRMSKVDRWVVHNVLQWMEENASTIEKIDGVSINLSGNSINEDGFLDFVLGELSASTVPREKICFEITETAAITSLKWAEDFMKTLKKTGCKFSLDDFGTGLSSYAYIQRLPVDFIKIDGVFIKDILTTPKDQALVKSINELAHFMNVETIAEYVENNEVKSILKFLGVDHTQGYGIGKPQLLDNLIEQYQV
jgi:diguanylate cyclase (GGDEF)-like protein